MPSEYEKIFWTKVSFKMAMTIKDAKYHLNDIHSRIINRKATLNDFSKQLQTAYKHYLDYLKYQL